jgi:hypothetical protein
MKFALTLAISAILAFAIACGGDDDGTEGEAVDVTPVGTKEATPEPAPVDPGNGVPEPVEPELDEELTEIARGDLEAVIDPGGSYEIDPEGIAADSGALDPCANFQFDFSWQITDPYPPDGTALSWKFANDTSEFEIASGPSGNQSVGCGLLRAENGGAAPITVAIKYAIASR